MFSVLLRCQIFGYNGDTFLACVLNVISVFLVYVGSSDVNWSVRHVNTLYGTGNWDYVFRIKTGRT